MKQKLFNTFPFIYFLKKQIILLGSLTLSCFYRSIRINELNLFTFCKQIICQNNKKQIYIFLLFSFLFFFRNKFNSLGHIQPLKHESVNILFLATCSSNVKVKLDNSLYYDHGGH